MGVTGGACSVGGVETPPSDYRILTLLRHQVLVPAFHRGPDSTRSVASVLNGLQESFTESCGPTTVARARVLKLGAGNSELRPFQQKEGGLLGPKAHGLALLASMVQAYSPRTGHCGEYASPFQATLAQTAALPTWGIVCGRRFLTKCGARYFLLGSPLRT